MISEGLLKALEESRNRKEERAVLALNLRVEEALQEAERLVGEFRLRDPSLERVVLFGSLAKGVPRNPDFDIDLSFEGRELYACVSIALDSTFKVDLVDYRNVPQFMRDEIDAYGRVLYEA